MIFAGYIGGAGTDEGNGIAVDSEENSYVTGVTNSNQTTFPVRVGPDLTYGGDSDAFVAKINAAGTYLLYAGYIGGNDEDRGVSIAVDSEGNAYITGPTFSSQTTFPVTVGPDLKYNGSWDAFVAKVNQSGSGLVYAGYIGSDADDLSNGIALDGDGNAYVVRNTESAEATFPVNLGPDITFNGGEDAFIAKVKEDGTGLSYCGYIGGASYEGGTGIAVNNAGNAYVSGATASSQDTFPVIFGPDLTYNGGNDAFAAKVNLNGTGLYFCGYIGGNSNENGNGIALDIHSHAYITGYTSSTEAAFPIKEGPDLTYNGGLIDAFVAKIRSDGSDLEYCGYIGGEGGETGNGITVDASFNVYITGYTSSNETTFPVVKRPFFAHKGGGFDVFVAKISESVVADSFLYLPSIIR